MIDGFAIAGYRSFGAKRAEIQDLGKVNVLIGPNNCGKSNILRFVSLLGSFLRQRRHNEAAPKLDPMLGNGVIMGSTIDPFNLRNDLRLKNMTEK